jgi:hypothetical protein
VVRTELIAQAWLERFNAKDLDGLLELYTDDCRHTSPKIRALHPETSGQLIGKQVLRAWWEDAFKRLPNLRYERTALTADEKAAVLEYVRHAPNEAPMHVAEVFEVRDGRIFASRVYHG